jgi:CTP:molybdopterin cytidylyltransferase MocA
MKARYAAIILAGGLSTRMKQFKPLLPLGKSTVINHVIDTFLNSGVDVFPVAGYRHDDIVEVIKNKAVAVVYNPDYEQGMFSSIQAGVRGLPPDYQAFFILPADIPLVRQSTIRLLMKEAAENPGRIIYPVYGGKRGHPPLIPSELAGDFLAWNKNGVLKAVLRAKESLALEVPLDDSSILFDIDTPEDYREQLEKFKQYKK